MMKKGFVFILVFLCVECFGIQSITTFRNLTKSVELSLVINDFDTAFFRPSNCAKLEYIFNERKLVVLININKAGYYNLFLIHDRLIDTISVICLSQIYDNDILVACTNLNHGPYQFKFNNLIGISAISNSESFIYNGGIIAESFRCMGVRNGVVLFDIYSPRRHFSKKIKNKIRNMEVGDKLIIYDVKASYKGTKILMQDKVLILRIPSNFFSEPL